MQQSIKTDRTHRELCRAALTLFMDQGFDRTSIADIVSLAGYSIGAFYRHYKTKSDILLELWRDYSDEFMAGTLEGAEKTADLVEGVDYLIRRSGQFFKHPLTLCYYRACGLPGSKLPTRHLPGSEQTFTQLIARLLRREFPQTSEDRLNTYASAIHAVLNTYCASDILDQDFYFDPITTREILLHLALQAKGSE